MKTLDTNGTFCPSNGDRNIPRVRVVSQPPGSSTTLYQKLKCQEVEEDTWCSPLAYPHACLGSHTVYAHIYHMYAQDIF